jgi:hypothetical protein
VKEQLQEKELKKFIPKMIKTWKSKKRWIIGYEWNVETSPPLKLTAVEEVFCPV